MMFMGRFYGADTMRARREAGLPTSLSCPDDFDEVLVGIGRLACEAHYGVGRPTINRWLEERGKQRLIAKRTAHVAERDVERREKLTRKEVGKLLAHAFPVRDRRRVSIILARRAAQHLRIIRNGGFIVSQAPNGDWRVGTRLLSAAQLVDLAKAKGFRSDLTGDEGEGVI